MPPQTRPIRISSWPRAIIHLDGDAFFASCEQALHPEYRGKPVITGQERGIVSAASYEAKAKGISRGVPLWEVKKLCPDAIIVPSDYESYGLFSQKMFAIMRRFTPTVEEYSIDEGFADITGMRRPMKASYEEIALRMKAAIESELGITVSVGLSLSKTLAKVGSKWKKPSGFTPIPGRKIHEFLAQLPAEKVWGIGPRTAAYCQRLGIRTALQFAAKDEEFVRKHFTKPHIELWQELNGHAVFGLATEVAGPQHTISKTRTFTPPSSSREFVFAQLFKNMENACIKARRHGLVAQGMVITLRTQEFEDSGVDARLSRPSAYPIELSVLLKELFEGVFDSRARYRATTVVLTGLAPDDAFQLSLFDPPLKLERLSKLYRAVDELAGAYGKHTVFTGGAAAAHLSPQHGIWRGVVPERQRIALPGEQGRKRLGIPILTHDVK
jgi:nucleotidyltransferase/DNA polymerase involved in DNA repair